MDTQRKDCKIEWKAAKEEFVNVRGKVIIKMSILFMTADGLMVPSEPSLQA